MSKAIRKEKAIKKILNAIEYTNGDGRTIDLVEVFSVPELKRGESIQEAIARVTNLIWRRTRSFSILATDRKANEFADWIRVFKYNNDPVCYAICLESGDLYFYTSSLDSFLEGFKEGQARQGLDSWRMKALGSLDSALEELSTMRNIVAANSIAFGEYESAILDAVKSVRSAREKIHPQRFEIFSPEK